MSHDSYYTKNELFHSRFNVKKTGDNGRFAHIY